MNGIVKRGIYLIAIKKGIKITSQMDMQSKIIVAMFSLFAELERDMLSMRTKQALSAKKAQGVKLGKPKGTLQSSRLDDKQEVIRELLRHKVSKSAVARMVNCSRTALVSYIKSRRLAA